MTAKIARLRSGYRHYPYLIWVSAPGPLPSEDRPGAGWAVYQTQDYLRPPFPVLNTGDAALFRAKLWARIRFQESAHRTPEGLHRNAPFLRYLRAPPPGLHRRPLN